MSECWIKVANLGDTEKELCAGYELGKLCQIKNVCREPGEPLKPVNRRRKKSLLDSLKIGQTFTGQQREELRNLLARFSNVFFTRRPLPLVDALVGVKHKVRVIEPYTPISMSFPQARPGIGTGSQERTREITRNEGYSPI